MDENNCWSETIFFRIYAYFDIYSVSSSIAVILHYEAANNTDIFSGNGKYGRALFSSFSFFHKKIYANRIPGVF